MRARVAGRKADQGIETEHGFHSKTSDRYVAGRKADQGIETHPSTLRNPVALRTLSQDERPIRALRLSSSSPIRALSRVAGRKAYQGIETLGSSRRAAGRG